MVVIHPILQPVWIKSAMDITRNSDRYTPHPTAAWPPVQAHSWSATHWCWGRK